MSPLIRIRTQSRRRNSVYFIIVLLSGVLIYFLTVREMRFFLVPSKSMVPTLVPKEYIVTLNDKQYARGDIVVLKDPKEKGGYLVKRLIGLEGDTVGVRGGALFINSLYASEPYLPEPIDYAMDDYVVSEGHVLVFGDNRNWSDDSHSWVTKGVKRSSIVGRVRAVYLPLGHVRSVVHYPLANVRGS